MTIENINEYYGLASSTENRDGVFHPLIMGPIYNLCIQGKDESNYFYFLVKIDKFFVLTCLRRKPG